MSVSWDAADGSPRRGLSWSELVDYAAKRLGFEDPDLLRVRGTDLQILEYYRIKNNNEMAPLRNHFLTELAAPDDALKSSPIHSALAELSNCSIYYTTNYDDYIERALTVHGRRAQAVATESHIAEILKLDSQEQLKTIQVVKFHGDLNSPERMVVSESDYEDRMALAEVEDQRLKSDLLGRAVLFIGYSFRDWNVSYLFRLINDQFGPLPSAPTGRRAYITIADPSDFEFELFRKRNIEVLPIRADHRAADIATLLRGLV